MKQKKKGKNFFVSFILFIVKIILLLLLGFLPSFLFIALFIQYGSPFSNYLNFLLDFKTSWMAWLSATLIILLIVSVGRAVKSPKKIKETFHDKKKLIITVFSIFFIVALIVGQLYLYVNFLLGNDILVSLSADKDNFFFTNSSTEKVNFKMSVTMNPFCVAECEYEFFDLSKGKLIESGAFKISSILSKTITYNLDKNEVPFGSQVLNTFELTCKSQKTILCFTSEDESKRNVLITLNNQLSDEEQIILESYKEEIISLKQIYYLSEINLNEYSKNIEIINGYFSMNYPFEEFLSNLSDLNESFYDIENLWTKQNLDYLEIQLPKLGDKTFDLYNKTSELKKNISADISIYNNLTLKIADSKNILRNVEEGNLSEILCNDLKNSIINFNDAVADFETEVYVKDKAPIVNNIYYEVVSLKNRADGNLGNFSCETSEITAKTFPAINYVFLNQTIPTITLNVPAFTCCYFGKCDKCCDDSCSDEDYPVIFLHGHSINGALPADYSFNTFTDIKNNLTKEGFIDAGTFAISKIESGVWGKIKAPVMVTASYFYDAYKTAEGETTTIASKTEGIDTYAIRLRNIVNTIKARTNKDKVIIIAHSMGGVVTRRYIQIFGGDDVDKIILVSVPNHGITDKVKDYCSVFGSETACNDMKEDSLLMSQINYADTDFVDAYNIIGVGCNMGDETGDGIVKNSSQFLDYAKNYYVNGTCDELSFNFLHENILYPKVHPETYEIIKKILPQSD